MEKRDIIVTGASQGLGLSIAREAVARGHNVHGIARSESPLDSAGYTHHQLDLTDSRGTASLFSWLAQEGVLRGALLVNSAGFYSSDPLEELDAEVMRTAFEANVVTALNSSLGFIRSADRGDLVFIASANALQPTPGSGAYGVAKAALGRLVESLELETESNSFRFMLVYSGSINTWSEEQEPGTIEAKDVAGWLLDAASSKNSYWQREALMMPR